MLMFLIVAYGTDFAMEIYIKTILTVSDYLLRYAISKFYSRSEVLVLYDLQVKVAVKISAEKQLVKSFLCLNRVTLKQHKN